MKLTADVFSTDKIHQWVVMCAIEDQLFKNILQIMFPVYGGGTGSLVWAVSAPQDITVQPKQYKCDNNRQRKSKISQITTIFTT